MNLSDPSITLQGWDVNAGGFNQTSDINKKNVIANDLSLSQCYDLINKCSTIIYALKDDKHQKHHLGLIAQEVEQYFPELVTTSKDGSKSLNYNGLIPVIMKVMKNVMERIDAIEEKLKNL